MKKNLKIRRVYSGQAIVIFSMILCLITASVLATRCLQKMNRSVTSENPSGSVKNDSMDVKTFPYNRYYKEVMIY
ncbi:MAG TPA: hypothetical protein VHO46_03310 [Bacteroidales bacterium]|nr:hypothetical protein [Bacteroidales bacterium]